MPCVWRKDVGYAISYMDNASIIMSYFYVLVSNQEYKLAPQETPNFPVSKTYPIGIKDEFSRNQPATIGEIHET